MSLERCQNVETTIRDGLLLTSASSKRCLMELMMSVFSSTVNGPSTWSYESEPNIDDDRVGEANWRRFCFCLETCLV